MFNWNNVPGEVQMSITKGKNSHKNRSSDDSVMHDDMLVACMHKISASGLFPDLIFYSKYNHPDVLFCQNEKGINMRDYCGFEPDGGSVAFKETPYKLELSLEAKYQGNQGQAGYALHYEKLHIMIYVFNGAKSVMFAIGPGADANPSGKNKTEKGKFETFNQYLKMTNSNISIYQKVDLFTPEEMMNRCLQELGELVGRPVETLEPPIIKSKSSKHGEGNLQEYIDV